MDMRKRIAVIVKKALKDPKQFKVYDIAISYSKVVSESFWIKKVEAESLGYDQLNVEDL